MSDQPIHAKYPDSGSTLNGDVSGVAASQPPARDHDVCWVHAREGGCERLISTELHVQCMVNRVLISKNQKRTADRVQVPVAIRDDDGGGGNLVHFPVHLPQMKKLTEGVGEGLPLKKMQPVVATGYQLRHSMKDSSAADVFESMHVPVQGFASAQLAKSVMVVAAVAVAAAAAVVVAVDVGVEEDVVYDP